MSDFDDVIAGWELSVTMQRRTPLRWLQRHREFHAGPDCPAEVLPAEHACWVPVTKTWRALGIDEDEIPESTMASEVGQIPVDGGDFLPFLIEYRMIVEDGGGTLADLASRYPQYRDLLFPLRKSRKRRAIQNGVARLSISIRDYSEIPGSKDQYHFNFEFHCCDCGGFILDTPDKDGDVVRCKACGASLGTLAKIKEDCREVALSELRLRKLGAFRDG
jgi:hypothetical protein